MRTGDQPLRLSVHLKAEHFQLASLVWWKRVEVTWYNAVCVAVADRCSPEATVSCNEGQRRRRFQAKVREIGNPCNSKGNSAITAELTHCRGSRTYPLSRQLNLPIVLAARLHADISKRSELTPRSNCYHGNTKKKANANQIETRVNLPRITLIPNQSADVRCM